MSCTFEIWKHWKPLVSNFSTFVAQGNPNTVRMKVWVPNYHFRKVFGYLCCCHFIKVFHGLYHNFAKEKYYTLKQGKTLFASTHSTFSKGFVRCLLFFKWKWIHHSFSQPEWPWCVDVYWHCIQIIYDISKIFSICQRFVHGFQHMVKSWLLTLHFIVQPDIVRSPCLW